MAIIYSYPIETNIQSTDLLIGTSTIVESGVQRNVTRSFSVGGLAAFINTDLLNAVTSIAFTAPLTGGTITSTGTVGITQAGVTSNGYLSSSDWNIFNSKFTPPAGTVNSIPVFTTTTSFGSSSLTDIATGVFSTRTLAPINNATVDLGIAGTGNWRDLYLSGTSTSANIIITGTLSANGSVGGAGQVLESQGAGQPSRWVNKLGGDVTAVQSSTLNQLTVADSTGPIPLLSIVTAAVANGGTSLATGDQIFDFVDNNYGAGTVTSIGMTVPAAFAVTPAAITTNGTFVISGSGTATQVVLGDGNLGTLNLGTVTSVGFTSDIAAFVVGASQPIVSAGVLTLNLTGGTAGQFLRQDGNWATISGGGTVTGTGVANSIPIWTSTSAVGDSMLTQNAAATLITNSGSFKTTSITDSSGSVGTSGQVLTAGAGGAVTWGTGAASYTKWVLTGQTGTQDINDGNTVLITSSNTAITTAAAATDTLTITSTPYTGGANIGHVPTGGDVTKYLDGNGGWQTTNTSTGTVTNVSSATPNLISVADQATTPAITAITSGGVVAGSTSLATGDQIQTAINDALVGFLEFKGGFNASTGAIVGGGNLTGAVRVAIAIGDFYVVTVAGDFYGDATEPLDIGDQVICQTVAAANASVIGDWVKVQDNVGLATATTVGISSYPTAGGLTVDSSGAVSVGSTAASTLAFVADGNNVDMTSTSLGVVNSTVQFTQGSAMLISESGGNNMTIDITDTGITAGTFYSPAAVVVDAQGRISSITENLTPPGIGGTIGKIPKFTASNTIGNSIMTETASLITTAGSIKPTTITDTNSGVGTAGQVLSSTGSALDWIDPASSINTILVTVVLVGAANYYFIDGAQQQSLELVAGVTYRLDQSATTPSPGNSGHRLKFSTTSDGTWNSGVEYTTGVTYSSATPGSAGAYTQIILEQDTPKLYYYCQYHSGMGGEVIDPRAGGLFTSFTATDGTFINLTPNTAQTGVVTLSADLSASGTASSTTFLSGGGANGSWQTAVTSLTTANSNYVNLANTGTASVPILTASLSAGIPASPATKFLRGDNTWQTISAAYTLNLTASTGGPFTVPSGSTIDISAGNGMVSTGTSSGTSRIATITPDYVTVNNIVLSAPTTLTTLADSDSIILNDATDNNVKDVALSTLKTYIGSISSSIAQDDFTGDGTQTSFALSTVPFSTTFTDVYISGVYQQKSTYSLSNGNQNILFSTAPPATASIEVMTVVTSNVIPGASSLVSQQFNGNGVTASFVLTAGTPANINFTDVYINGVYQEKTVYTVTGNVLAFNAGGIPQTGDLVEVMIMTAVSLVQVTASNYGVSTISTNTQAIKNTLYVFTASLTLTLPASPATGDSIKISNLSAVATCVLARNGSLIMGVATDLTLNNAVASFELIYSGATKGWVIIGPQ